MGGEMLQKAVKKRIWQRGGRGIMAIIKVIMFQSESCAVADQDINGETIKMQITGWGGFGK